jgi:two-component system sensor histidine kinase MprB
VKQVVLKHGGALRVEYAVPGGQPPGTAIHMVLPGRPMPDEERHAAAAVDLPMVRADND